MTIQLSINRTFVAPEIKPQSRHTGNTATTTGAQDTFVAHANKNSFARPMNTSHVHDNIIKLAKIFPHSARDLHGGENEVYLVNDTMIFRFPKDERSKSVNISEQALLQSLHARMTATRIPLYVLFDQNTGAGAYREIPGKPFSRRELQQLRPEERTQLAIDLGKSIGEIHSLPIEEASMLPVLATHKKYDFDKVASLINSANPFSTIDRQKIQDALDTVREMLSRPESWVVLHGDLHEDNIIFNNKKKCLAGVIDFSEAKLGPAAVDFGGFYRLNGQFTETLQREYASRRGIDEQQFISECRAWAIVQHSTAAFENQHAQTPLERRRLARAGFALRYLLNVDTL